MKDKRALYRRLAQLRHAKTWQLVVVLLIGVVLSATLLRLNNLGMIERREAVIEADQGGDTGEIRKALLDLQRYVSSHMNTDLGNGVYLSYSYDRDREAAISRAADASNPNSAVYEQASVECRERWQGGRDSFRNDYVRCVIDRVAALSAANDPLTSLALPAVDNYRYNFVSPLWSPDLAGVTVLLCVVIALVIIGRLAAMAILKAMLNRRFSAN